jgi:hypothetical protein
VISGESTVRSWQSQLHPRAGHVIDWFSIPLRLPVCGRLLKKLSIKGEFVSLSTNRHSFVTTFLGVTRGALVCWPFTAIADEARAPPVSRPDTVLVTAKRRPETVPDEQLKMQAETALHDDPYFYDEHVTVTVKNGVVHLQGIVFDDGDAQAARLIVKRKVAGARRVVNELEICACDGGA